MTGWCCFCVSVGTTLGSKAVVLLYVGTTLGGIVLGVELLNICAITISSAVCMYPSVTNVMDVDILRRAWINY